MKRLFLIITATFVMAKSYSQQYEIVGIDNSYKTDKSFSMGGESIKKSMIMDLHNLNLYEYAHSLKELYELLSARKITEKDWNNYIDDILLAVEKERTSSKRPYWGVDYMGIAPLQAEFFLSSLDLSDSLKSNYPREYDFLKKSASKLKGIGYSMQEIDSLLIVADKDEDYGTVNYWFFLQVIGCPIYNMAKERVDSVLMNSIMKRIDVPSTYKVPQYLQMRKLRLLKLRIQPCWNNLKGGIDIYDNVEHYYDNPDNEYDRDKLKFF